MIHFIPDSREAATLIESPADAAAAGPYAEAVARLASIRRALSCVEQVAGDEPSERDSEARLAVRWPAASTAARRCFDARSAKSAAAAASGLELLAARAGAIHPAAARSLADELRRGLDDIDQLFSL